MAEANHAEGAYKIWRDAAEKFDYHIVTISAAATAWGVQTMTLTGLNWQSGLQASGLALLGASTYVGLRRIEGSVQVYLMSLGSATNTDRYSALIKQELANHAVGETVDIQKVSKFEAGMKAHKSKTREHAQSLKRPYLWRKRLLITGLVLYSIGRGWSQVATSLVQPATQQPPVRA